MPDSNAKRAHDEEEQGSTKRQKTDSQALMVTPQPGAGAGSIIAAGPVRTSALQAPTMALTGHGGEVYTVEFNHDGTKLASTSFDKQIFLWNTYGECENYMVLKGHTNAVLDVHWAMDSGRLYSCSADKTVAVWDAETGRRIKKFTDHTSFVNSCSIARRGPEMLVSGSDDGTTKLWDVRQRKCVDTFSGDYQVTAVCLSDSSDKIFSGSLDNDIKIWDIRKGEVIETLSGHTDTITGLSLSPDGAHLLSNSMDNSLNCWDVRPFVSGTGRLMKVFKGHQHTVERNLLKCRWSADGSRVACGSGDRQVYVWDATSQKILYRLPGHLGCVNDVCFHPKEPIIASAGSDKKIFVGEIEED
eukprot:GFYU01014967.1.p1 GENE.GFYU01014967.1~~GFYU01014967.1.p1  ORF type:complete len:358 (-),score=109.62 GFYU01014967.1:83-1156(-)